MESNTSGSARDVLSTLKHPLFMGSIGLGVILFMLLLFARDLADGSGFRSYLIGAVTAYLICNLFLIQIEINLLNHARNQAGENSQHFPPFEKSPTSKRFPRIAKLMSLFDGCANALGHITLRCLPSLQVVLLFVFIFYLFWRNCL